MATISITGVGITGCYWQINGLGFLWDTAQYNSAYCTFNGVASASIFPPTPPGSSFDTPITLYSNLVGGTTYSAIGYAVTPSGTYATTNTFTFTTAMARPPSYNWSLSKSAGSVMQVSASEWSALQQNCNQVRQYKSLATVAFTSVSVGMQVDRATLFNEVINAISPMNANVLPTVTTSTRFNDSALFARIQNSLNAIT